MVREPLTGTHFSKEDDECLIQIMEGRLRALKPGEWEDAVLAMGKFSSR
jgi:hypothetical protein